MASRASAIYFLRCRGNMPDSANGAMAPALAPSRRRLWKVWLAVVAAFIGIAVLPVSNTLTRFGSIVTLLLGWGLLTTINWRHRWLRIPLLLTPTLCAAFLLLPPRAHESTKLLRHDFIDAMRRY